MQVLPEVGFYDPHNGMYVDQKILPLLAQLFSSQVGCTRHPGYNVADWNLHEREITRVDNRYLISGQPAIFFHLSGFRAEDPNTFSRYGSWNFNRLPVLKDIVGEYLSYIPSGLMAKRSDYLYDYIGSYRLSSELSGIILFTAPLLAIEQLGSRGECEDGYAFTKGDICPAGSALSLSPDFFAHRPTSHRLPMRATLGRQSPLVQLTSCDDPPCSKFGPHVGEIHASINSLLCQQIFQY